MATAVNTGDIVQVTPRYLIEGQQCENVWYFQCYTADPNMLANLLLIIAQCIITHLLPALSNNVQLESVRGKIVGPAVGADDEWTPGVGDVVAGAAAGDAEPSFVSAVVSLHTARAGRSGRGRIYIGGIPESQTTASLLNTEGPLWAAILATLNCIATAFPLEELGTGAHYQWGIYSRKDGAVIKPPFPTTGFHAITRYKLNQELGTTRSRKLGRGK